MSKFIVGFALAAAMVGAPILSFAQSNAPLTRAEVRADLVRVERAGYMPGTNDINYPSDIQAAEAKIAAQNDQQIANHGVGGVADNGATASGMKSSKPASNSDGCVGPVSFCTIFFGGS